MKSCGTCGAGMRGETLEMNAGVQIVSVRALVGDSSSIVNSVPSVVLSADIAILIKLKEYERGTKENFKFK